MHLVSFVVTVYNKTPSLPHLAASLLAQTGPFEREFIFVDDGSTDNSVAVLEQLTQGAEHVRIHRQANAGPAAATNAGFLLARGDVIKPMDADDVLAPACGGFVERAGRDRSEMGLLSDYAAPDV
jgi:glycosyltransferase involved in cell wall biosynthesis